MVEAAQNKVANESMNAQRQNIPAPVKMVAAGFLLGAVVHSFLFACLLSTARIGPFKIALFKHSDCS